MIGPDTHEKQMDADLALRVLCPGPQWNVAYWRRIFVVHVKSMGERSLAKLLPCLTAKYKFIKQTMRKPRRDLDACWAMCPKKVTQSLCHQEYVPSLCGYIVLQSTAEQARSNKPVSSLFIRAPENQDYLRYDCLHMKRV